MIYLKTKFIFIRIRNFSALLIAVFGLTSCSKEESTGEPNLIVKFKFDKSQERLNNIGQLAVIPSGNSAQSPLFNSISAHYFELAPTALTALGSGTVLYHAPETTSGGEKAIDFSKAIIVKEGEAFLTIPLRQLKSGTYEWVRCSLSYQNYSINIWQSGANLVGNLASFLGYNTYITKHNIGSVNFDVNANRKQGYWALNVLNNPFSGQAPEGATTVPNPIFSTSPVPQGSCVVTGKFINNLVITGTETKNIEVTLSLSINNSFEWEEVNKDGKFEPSIGEKVVDMGLRGLIPSFSN